MARIVSHKKTGVTAITEGKVHNKEGGEAFELKPKHRLVTGILTCLVNEPKFYGDTTPEIIESTRKMIEEDPEFVAKAACYARNVFHMRSISQVLAAEVAKNAKGNPIIRKMIRKIIERPDDMCNILAYHFKTWGPRKKGNSITRGMRRGFADVFPRFDEYSLAKYKGTENDVKLRDVLLVSRPKPKDDAQAALWKRLIENRLETPKTRETVLSEEGQSKETWEKLIDGKFGYMAMLRNLKNILNNNVDDEHLAKVCVRLADPKEVAASKQLPFRFFSAYKMLQSLKSMRDQKVMDALITALELSFANILQLKGNTAIICDESGSMRSPLSGNSIIQMTDIGNLLGAAASKFCENSIVIPFGTEAKTMHFSKKSTIFDNMAALDASAVGESTELHKAFAEIDKIPEKIDRILIFSDQQAYGDGNDDHSFLSQGLTYLGLPRPRYGQYPVSCQQWTNEYRARKNPKLWIHSIDLQGYGTTKVCGNQVNLVAGWSDKVLEFIDQVEKGGDELVNAIEKYVI